MKKLTLSVVLALSIGFSISQTLVSATQLSSKSSAQVQGTLNAYGWNASAMTINPVVSYTITYNTVDVHGNATVASGAVYLPTLAGCEYAPMIAYNHGTEFKKNNVPSNGAYSGQGLFFSTTGFISVLPDYLGLGVNSGIHPYQHAESEATATLDLIRAVREFLDTNTVIHDNGQLFLTGYSQGGHAAMATNKYIEEHNMTSEFEVIACAPLSGAYDQSGSQFDLIFDGDSNYYAAVFLPYILGSYQEAYGTIYQNFNELYDSPFDVNINTYLNAGTYSFSQWMTMLGGANYYNFMQDSVLQNILADVDRDSHPINIALAANNLYDWVPQNPVRMMYCGNDSMVSPNNAIFTLDTMVALGATAVEALNMSPTGDHNSCFNPATANALTWFESNADKCSNYASILDNENLDLNVYPNPAKYFLTITGISIDSYDVAVYSILGKQFEVIQTNNVLNIEKLPSGVYFVVFTNTSSNTTRRIRFVKG